MLGSERVRLRPMTVDDLPRIREILAQPAVAAWWDSDGFEGWEADESEPQFTIEVGGKVAGMIQYSEEPDPRYRQASVDLFLATEFHGRGLGREAIELIVEHLFEERGHHRIVIDPAAANQTAIRCYESVGFSPVGVMRAYELDHNTGDWQDGLLMEIVKADAASAP